MLLNRGKELPKELFANIPVFASNAIVINEAEGKRDGADDTFIMDGIYADERNPSQIHLVEIGVVHYRNEYNAGIRSGRVCSFVQQKEDAALSTELGSKKSYTQTSSELRGAQLLEIASKTYPNELSKDVLKHLGLKRKQ